MPSKPTLSFLAVLGLAIIVRLVLALTWDGYWGVDGGASILNVNYVLGNEPTGAGFPKPPLAPGFTLAPFILTMGADIGYKVWSALFATLPLIPVFLLTRKYVGGWPAVAATLFASVDWFWGEMFVTGAHPLVAFALLGMAWYSMAEKAEGDKGGVHTAIIIISVGLIPWVNQTAAGLAIILLPIFYLALCWYKRSILQDVLRPCLMGGIIAVGAIPWYMQTLPGSALLTYDGPIIFWAWGVNTVQGFFVALPLGLYLAWRCPDYRVRALGVVLIALAALLPWMSFDEVLINPPYRARYLLSLVFYPSMAWVVFKVWIPYIQKIDLFPVAKNRPINRAWTWPRNRVPMKVNGKNRYFIIIVALIAFVYMSGVFIWVVRDQAGLSAMVTPETAKALELIEDGNVQDGTTQATATNSFTLSLWVAGLKRVPSPFLTTAPPPPAYVESDKLLRCSFGWVDDCDGRVAARELGLRYILVEERFPHYNEFVPGNYLAPDNQWEVTANTEWLHLIFSEGTTRLYEVD